MAHDLSVASLTGPSGISLVATVAVPPPPASAASQVVAAPLIPNPEFKIDPASGIVVIEFRHFGGKVKNTIPSQQQLDAYDGRSMTMLTDPRSRRTA